MKNILFLNLIFIALLMGCRSDTPVNEPEDGATQTQSAAVNPSDIKFICQTAAAEANDNMDAPRHEVFLQIGNSKVKVADILNCEILNKDSYEQNQIPANAIAAVGGWWAGAGDYLYIVEEGGNYVVKKGATAEEMTNNDFGYKTIMTFDKTGNEVF